MANNQSQASGQAASNPSQQSANRRKPLPKAPPVGGLDKDPANAEYMKLP